MKKRFLRKKANTEIVPENDRKIKSKLKRKSPRKLKGRANQSLNKECSRRK
jgi:hypothetical protein